MGVGLEYSKDSWTVDPADIHERSIFMTGPLRLYSVLVYVVPATEATPAKLASDRLASLKTWAPDLTDETDAKFQVLGIPTIGYREATGSMFVGTHGIEPVSVVLLSGGDDNVSVLVQVESDKLLRGDAFQLADPVVNSFRWP